MRDKLQLGTPEIGNAIADKLGELYGEDMQEIPLPSNKESITGKSVKRKCNVPLWKLQLRASNNNWNKKRRNSKV